MCGWRLLLARPARMPYRFQASLLSAHDCISQFLAVNLLIYVSHWLLLPLCSYHLYNSEAISLAHC